MLKQLGFIILISQKGRAQAASRVTRLLPEWFSPFAPLSGAKDSTFSKIKDLPGSQLKEGLDQPRFREEGFELQVALE